jgi:Rps23 Pro-64 3,4-dihydroxylase Tpa1-like proline 4-hydroxylase
MSVQPAATTGPFEINPRLDTTRLRTAFARQGRLHIADFLADDGAQRLSARLAGERDWTFVINRGNTHFELTPEQSKRMPGAAHQALMRDIMAEARDGFQLAYDVLNITRKGRVPLTDDPVLVGVYALLNSAAFLDLIDKITGVRGEWSDATCTRYRPGHFCEMHDDKADDGDRLIAFVLNVTPRWRVDWGGVLQFIDKDDHVSEGYTPAFNALNIFRVPQQHAVSIVAPFAGGDRLSVTGWVRR